MPGAGEQLTKRKVHRCAKANKLKLSFGFVNVYRPGHSNVDVPQGLRWVLRDIFNLYPYDCSERISKT